ncbi:MAG: DUF1127 domain-containing protein [Acetobacteraceae bacterium]|jgi:uncharacterized protein YjiS (DUF1127 family)|nr:DUF1127 domain-containing protein [Acetobacteraceae bacterium]
MSLHHPTEWLRSHDVGASLAEHLEPKAESRARLTHAAAAMRKRARERRALHDMSDRELRDIGIPCADIDRVFGPAFVREFAASGVLGEWRRLPIW